MAKGPQKQVLKPIQRQSESHGSKLNIKAHEPPPDSDSATQQTLNLTLATADTSVDGCLVNCMENAQDKPLAQQHLKGTPKE